MSEEETAPAQNDAGPRRKAPPAKEPCDFPGCGKLISPWQMENHKRIAHGPPLSVVEDQADWRCPMCGSDVHARSLTRPDRCVRCAERSSANGVEAAA
jgi:hypothetical protein